MHINIHGSGIVFGHKAAFAMPFSVVDVYVFTKMTKIKKRIKYILICLL